MGVRGGVKALEGAIGGYWGHRGGNKGGFGAVMGVMGGVKALEGAMGGYWGHRGGVGQLWG